jgi:hypothetical protein
VRSLVFVFLAGCGGFSVDITKPLNEDMGAMPASGTSGNTTGSGTSGNTTGSGTTGSATTGGGTTGSATTGGGTTGSAETCSICQNKAYGAGGACESVGDTCSNDNRCQTLQICGSNCGNFADTTCINQCAGGSPDPTVVNKYNAAVDCICNTACASECSNVCGA